MTNTKKIKDFQGQEVYVKEVKRAGGWYIKSDDSSSLMSDTKIGITVGYTDGQLNDPMEGFSKEEIEEFAKLIHRKPEDFNIYNPKSIWRGYQAYLGKQDRKLNLSNPKDFLDYLVFLQAPNMVAKDEYEALEVNPETRFMMVNKDHEIKSKKSKIDKEKEAFDAYNKLSMKDNGYRDFLLVYGKMVTPSATKDWMQGQIYDIMKEKPEIFMEIIKDPDFDMKSLIQKALICKALIKSGKTGYALSGGKGIGDTIQETLDYLKDKENNTELITIMGKVEASI